MNCLKSKLTKSGRIQLLAEQEVIEGGHVGTADDTVAVHISIATGRRAVEQTLVAHQSAWLLLNDGERFPVIVQAVSEPASHKIVNTIKVIPSSLAWRQHGCAQGCRNRPLEKSSICSHNVHRLPNRCKITTFFSKNGQK